MIDQPTNRPTNQPTNQPTDKAGCRVACTRLKRMKIAAALALTGFFYRTSAVSPTKNIQNNEISDKRPVVKRTDNDILHPQLCIRIYLCKVVLFIVVMKYSWRSNVFFFFLRAFQAQSKKYDIILVMIISFSFIFLPRLSQSKFSFLFFTFMI